MLLYADDTVIFSESPHGLQSGLDKVKLYCDKWNFKLNVNKCKIVVFSRGKVRKFAKLQNWRRSNRGGKQCFVSGVKT